MKIHPQFRQMQVTVPMSRSFVVHPSTDFLRFPALTQGEPKTFPLANSVDTYPLLFLQETIQTTFWENICYFILAGCGGLALLIAFVRAWD